MGRRVYKRESNGAGVTLIMDTATHQTSGVFGHRMMVMDPAAVAQLFRSIFADWGDSRGVPAAGARSQSLSARRDSIIMTRPRRGGIPLYSRPEGRVWP